MFIVSSYLLPPIETDLYGEEMSSVRQSTDERETVKRGDKSRPKACTQLRSCRKWKVKKKKKKKSSLGACFPGEVTSWRAYVVNVARRA